MEDYIDRVERQIPRTYGRFTTQTEKDLLTFIREDEETASLPLEEQLVIFVNITSRYGSELDVTEDYALIGNKEYVVVKNHAQKN